MKDRREKKVKKYTIEIVQDSKSFSMERNNKGFGVFELIGFVELIRSELITQAKSMLSNMNIERKFNTPGFLEGNVEIDKNTVTVNGKSKEEGDGNKG